MFRRLRYCFLNQRVAAGLWLASIGAWMNWTVTMANGGMPVLGQAYRDGIHIPMTDQTKRAWLGDWITMQCPMYIHILSPGDFLIYGGLAMGVFGIIYSYCRCNWSGSSCP